MEKSPAGHRVHEDGAQGRHAMFRVTDLFCGTGAISFGLSQADSRFALTAGIDLDAAACRTARANHPGAAIVTAPIEGVSSRELLDSGNVDGTDVIVGGPPCQGFSSLRPSRGTTLDDPRNRLYREFQRMVGELRPKIFLMENVVGLVHATKGQLLHDILQGFGDLGYRCDWRILNAANYGVPQKRERFFLLGVHSDVRPDLSIRFPEPTHSFSGRTIGIRDRHRMVASGDGLAPAVTAWDAMSDLPSLHSGEACTSYRSSPRNRYQERMRSDQQTLTLHQAADHSQKMQLVMRYAGASKSALPDGLVSSGYSSCYSRIGPDEPAPTITVKFTSPASSKCIHPFDHRAITPREAARLQSFPDTFEFVGSKTEVAAQLGNAVPPLLAASFAPIIASYLDPTPGQCPR